MKNPPTTPLARIALFLCFTAAAASAQPATPLALGQTIQGQIGSFSQIDRYAVGYPGGAPLFVDVKGAFPSIKTIQADGNPGPIANGRNRVFVRLAEMPTGTVMVLVSSSDNSGGVNFPYTITLTRALSPDPPDKTVPVVVKPPDVAVKPPGVAVKPPGVAVKPPGVTVKPPDVAVKPPAVIVDPQVPLVRGSAKGSLTVFEIGSVNQVFNGPTRPYRFQVAQRSQVKYIQTYHWNRGHGTPAAGKVGLKNLQTNKATFWTAVGREGQGGAPNAYWDVRPTGAIVEPGIYEVIDGDPSTWAQNEDSGGRGFALVHLDAATITPSGHAQEDLAGRKVWVLESVTPEKRVSKDSEVYFNNSVEIADGSASASNSWQDPPRYSGKWNVKATWTPPPPALTPGEKIPFTISMACSATQNGGYRNIGGWVTFKVNGAIISEAKCAGASNEVIKPTRLQSEFEVPAGNANKNIEIQVLFGASIAGGGNVVYRYVLQNSAAR